MSTYTIISKQDTYVAWDRCGGYDGTYDGGFHQEWFTDRDAALAYWAEWMLKDKYIIPHEDNSYSYGAYPVHRRQIYINFLQQSTG